MNSDGEMCAIKLAFHLSHYGDDKQMSVERPTKRDAQRYHNDNELYTSLVSLYHSESDFVVESLLSIYKNRKNEK